MGGIRGTHPEFLNFRIRGASLEFPLSPNSSQHSRGHMKTRRCLVIAVLLLLFQSGFAAPGNLPAQLTEDDFVKLSSEASEPVGTVISFYYLSITYHTILYILTH